MLDIEKWNKIIDYFGDNKGKKVKIFCIDGNVYDGIVDGYGADDDSNGNSVWAIWTQNRIFLREYVEKIEFID